MYLQLIAPNKTVVAARPFTYAGTVSTFTFNDAQIGPVYPNATSLQQTSSASLNSLIRYVRITSAPSQCLMFRELMVSHFIATLVIAAA